MQYRIEFHSDPGEERTFNTRFDTIDAAKAAAEKDREQLLIGCDMPIEPPEWTYHFADGYIFMYDQQEDPCNMWSVYPC